MTKTVVLGAGPAGLACADVLTQAGKQVAVYERAPGVGGLTRTVVRNGFRFDLGGHRWFTKNQELNQYFLELMGGELVQVQRTSRIFFRGRFCKYPLEPLDVMKSLDPLTLARIFLDYSLARLRVNHQPDHSFEDWVVRRFGRALFELFFRSYSEKVWGIPCDRISSDWAAQRIRNLSIPAMIRNSLFGGSEGGPKSLVDQFWYPALGYGRITERLAQRITPQNNIHLRAEVIALRHDGGRVRAVRIRTEAGEEWVDADHVVSSIPITELVRRMQPHAPAHVRDATDSLTFRNLITVHLMLKKKQVSADTWVYVQDPEFHMARFHEPKNWSASMVPDASVTSLVCEYFCNQDDEFWGRSEPEIVDLAARELATMGFLHPSEVREGFIIRIPQAYPVYSTTYQKPLDTIKDYLAEFSNLQMVGRYGRFRYNNTDHALETGILAARNILGSRYNLDCVNNEAEYLEEIGERRRSEAQEAQAGPPGINLTNLTSPSEAPLVSIIIPVYNGADTLPACLAGIRASKYRDYELILVDDASTDGSAAIGTTWGCRVIVVNGRRGAAHCRNVGAAAARGEVLLSIDADVVIRPSTIRQAVQSLADGRWDAVFGSYTSETPAAGFFSQFHNLLHHYTHQRSQESAVTFWTGCGAVRRKAFNAVGGFDERHPPLEDIALGYALSAAGFRIRLDKRMQVTHLKKYSFLKLLRSYLFGRAVPWTRIMLVHRAFRSDLNTRPEHVLSVTLACLLPLSVLGAAWHWLAGVVALGTELGLLWANRNFLGFLRRQRGWWFAACGALQLHLFYLVCGVGAVGGLLSYWRFLRVCPKQRQLEPLASVKDGHGKSPATAIGLRGECQSE